MSSINSRAIAILLAVVLAAVVALLARPTERLVEQVGPLELESLVPREFAGWLLDERQSAAVVNPQAAGLQGRIYQQVLSRTYIHAASQRSIMLSIAYGENQNRANDLHVPDVCYSAGGFRIEHAERGDIQTSQGVIPVKRLIAQRLQRREPLTYWTIIGDQVATSAVGSKLIALSYGLRGTVPDGMIFRVSSVGVPDEQAFANQQEFVKNLMDALPDAGRKRLAGL
nr:exosortase-associated protein EpsI, B-type [uncultured Pseudomonas sp.]